MMVKVVKGKGKISEKKKWERKLGDTGWLNQFDQNWDTKNNVSDCKGNES